MKRKTSYANALTKSILQWLAVKGIMAWRNNTQGTFDPNSGRWRRHPGRKGISDILGLIPPSGRLLAIEVKSPRDRMSPDQIAFKDDVEAAGGVFVEARRMEDVIEALGGMK